MIQLSTKKLISAWINECPNQEQRLGQFVINNYCIEDRYNLYYEPYTSRAIVIIDHIMQDYQYYSQLPIKRK